MYNFTKPEELNNFKKVFQEYLIYYIKNYDTIESLIIPNTYSEISRLLIDKGKKIRKNPIIPQRNSRMNGLYGELFNDFYLRNICNSERFIAYISKRSYESGNHENKGIDNVVCAINDNSLEIILSEAKFLISISNSSTGLVDDTEHVNLNFINDYMNIVLQKQADLIPERKAIINDRINAINDLVEEYDKTFIEAINQLGYSIKFVYFAIFNDSDRELLKYKSKIDNIVSGFNKNIITTGIINYSIEIVFIPTFNTSMELKNYMEEWD